jgi:hypothetical protein
MQLMKLWNGRSVPRIGIGTWAGGAGRWRDKAANETANYKLPILFKSALQPTVKIRKRYRGRAERIRLIGGPNHPLGNRQSLSKTVIVRVRDLTDIGIPRCYLK